MKKENNNDESDFSENEKPDLNSLKPFEFEPKSNIGDITSSQKQPSEMFNKKGVLRIFAKFTGKHLCQRLFFNKDAGLSPEILRNRSQILRSESLILGNELQALRSESQILRNKLQILRNESQALRSESLTCKNESQTLRSKSWILRNKLQILRSESQALRSESLILRNELQALRSESQILRNKS